jgi:hypothetical protein
MASLISPVPLFSYVAIQETAPEIDYMPAAPLSRRERRAWARLCRDLSTPAVPDEPPARKNTSG